MQPYLPEIQHSTFSYDILSYFTQGRDPGLPVNPLPIFQPCAPSKACDNQ